MCLDPAVYFSLDDVTKFGIKEVLYKPFVQVEFFGILRRLVGVPVQSSSTFNGKVFKESSIHAYDLKGKKVLVVDDDEAHRKTAVLLVSQPSFPKETESKQANIH